MEKRKGRPRKRLVRTTVAVTQKTLHDIEVLKDLLQTSRNEIVRQAVDVLGYVALVMQEGDYLALVSKDGTSTTRIVLPGLTRGERG